MNFFLLGLFLIPFDNLFFAPVSGWATIAPFAFFLYVLFRFNKIGKVLAKEKNVLVFIIVIFCLQFIMQLLNGINISTFIDACGTFILGLVFYLAMILRYEVLKKDFNKDAKVLYIAYVVSFIYGLIRLLALKVFNGLIPIFEVIEKRTYDRLAFSFTEPSFIGMHIFGVLLLYTYFVSDIKMAKKMIKLGCLFLIVAVLGESGTRCIVDIVAFMGLFFLKIIIKERKRIFRNLVVIISGMGIFKLLVDKSSRLQRIIEGGLNFKTFNLDASLASRWFRINAAIRGFVKRPFNIFMGYGMGNMNIPLNDGYDEALKDYGNAYILEIETLKNATKVDSLFCMPIKLISDFGLIATIFMVIYFLYKAIKKHVDIFVVFMTMWLYIQFDSYAFYSMWLLLYLVRYYNKERFGKSYFEYFSNIFKIKLK